MSNKAAATVPVRHSTEIPWEETRLYLPQDETEEENKALYDRLKREIAQGHPVDEYDTSLLARLTPLQQREVGIPIYFIRPVTPHLVSNDANEVRVGDMARLEDELYAAEQSAGIQRKQPFVVRMLEKYADWKVNRPRHLVDKRVYLILAILLGWCGAHRFYEHRWKLGLFYLAVGWTGIGLAFALVDVLIALPLAKNEDGLIAV